MWPTHPALGIGGQFAELVAIPVSGFRLHGPFNEGRQGLTMVTVDLENTPVRFYGEGHCEEAVFATATKICKPWRTGWQSRRNVG
mmetsp:Transcript_9799/g.19968  ORF Transcript_9799/g.19968 Transcript_9799/m.19968 type:complete len:85 (-) Transcript_9799:985-1239(-)